MMKRFSLSVLLFFCLSVCSFSIWAQGRRDVYAVGFYNLENLFDTIHDKGKNDYEFLPDGTYRWGTAKYRNKLMNVATVLNEMSTDVTPDGMSVVGVCEVENRRVLDDLVEHKVLAHRGWKYVHAESGDSRGVDCALLYNPILFKPAATTLVPYTSVDGNMRKTRGFLVVSGEMAGESVHVIVNHWPSRSATSAMRERAGILVRVVKDSIMRENPATKVIIMGDMNDNPDDASMRVCLGAKCKRSDVKLLTDIYNPWCDVLFENGQGTLRYRGRWNLYDQIVVSGNMLGAYNKGLVYYKPEVFVRDYLLQHEGKYKGSPKRTHAGGVWLNGYSDHLPVILYLVKSLE